MKQRLINLIRGSFLVDEKYISNWIYIFLFLILGLVMISSSHSIDKKVYEIAGLNDEIKSFRSEFVDVRSALMKLRMESSINERLSKKGIISSKTSPIQIIIDVTN